MVSLHDPLHNPSLIEMREATFCAQFASFQMRVLALHEGLLPGAGVNQPWLCLKYEFEGGN